MTLSNLNIGTSYYSETQPIVNLLVCPTSTTNQEWKGVLERGTCSAISKNYVLSSASRCENCGEWRGRAKEICIHTGILESEANYSEQQGGLEVNVKHLSSVLKCGQTSGSSNAIKRREAHVELFYWTREGKFCWRIYLKKYFFVLNFFSVRKILLFSWTEYMYVRKKNSMLTSLGYYFSSLQIFRIRLTDI